MNYKYNNSILGGTFDHMHLGHKNFLHEAFKNSEKITIGLATNSLFTDKIHYSVIESYEDRKKTLERFLDDNQYKKRASIIKLNDIYGNSLSDKNIDAIFIAKTGLANAKLINEKRKEKGYKSIEVVVVPLTNGTDGEAISSTSIRSGIEDRMGQSYLKFFENVNLFILPTNLRSKLKQPFGKVLRDTDLKELTDKFLIAVGDVTVAKLVSQNVVPNISIYDFITKRQAITDNNVLRNLPKASFVFSNEPGTIHAKVACLLQEKIHLSLEKNKKMGIRIIGEEDLLTLPSILFAPLGSHVLYGIRDIGIIDVVVSEKNKELIHNNFLVKFDKK